MKNIKFKILVFFSFILIMGSVNTFAASTPMDIMNNLIGPSEQYNAMVTPAYTRNNTSDINISPQTGELNIAQTDYVLPGVNGLDLQIKRLYKSGSGTAYKSSVQYQNGVLVDYLDNTTTPGNFYDCTFYEKRYNLGCGWRFSFPTIENQGGYYYLHTESGDVYSLSGPTNGVYTINNHPVQDITVKNCASTAFVSQDTNSSGQAYTMYSYFVMTDKNGKNTYFDSDGRILGIVDKNGNKITFQYKDFVYNLSEGAMTRTLISKIIDTMGRNVNIDYIEDPTFQRTATDLQHKFEVVITLPNGKTIVYDKSCMMYANATLHVIRTRLQFVYDVDATLPITSSSKLKYYYGYSAASLGFTYLNGTTYNAANNNIVDSISQMNTCKTNKIKVFSYGDINNKMYRFVKPLSYSGYSGSMEYRKIVEVQDYDSYDSSIKNDVKYSYTNEPQGYTYDSPTSTWKIASTYNINNLAAYNYYVQITDGRGSKTKLTYDGNGQNLGTENSGNDHKEVITTTYDANKMPQKTQTVTYNTVNGITSNSITKTENYVYDQKGNLTQYTGPDATRDSNGNLTGGTYTTADNITVNEHTVVYTYDPTFSLPTSKTWKQNASTICRTEYTIDQTNGNITQSRNIHTGNNVITDYQYDSKGNITQKKVHYADNSGNTYVTNYVYGSEEDGIDRGSASAKYNGLYYGGAYLTREYSVVDGTQISKKYAYDFNTGNKTDDYDQKGNKTHYDYDMFSRIVKITYPDQSNKQYTYYDFVGYNDYYGNLKGNRVIVYTDPNGYSFEYVYDILDNLVVYSVWSNYNGSNVWKVLRQMSYDANSNKIKEMDADGHSTQYTYDSANRIIGKSFWSNDTTKMKAMTLQYTLGSDSNTSLLVTITDEDGYIKRNHYDVLNRLIKLDITPDNTNFYSTNYTYDYVSHKISEADPYNNTNNYTYDDLGYLKSQGDARSHTLQYSYDAGGKLIQSINQRGKSSYFDFDLLGRLIRKKVPSSDGTLAITRYLYDVSGNKTKEITPNNYDASKDTPSLAATMTGVSYTYNNMDRLQSTISPEGSIIDFRSYDAKGNMTKIVDGLRYTGDINSSLGTVYTYDAFNRVGIETNALGKMKQYSYYLTGQLYNATDENGNTTTYFYTPDGNLQKVVYPDGTYVTYSYDNRGNMTSASDQNNNLTRYVYNGYGKIDTVTDAQMKTISYKYFNNGNLQSVKDKKGHYTYYSYYPDYDLQEKKTQIDATNYSIEDYETDECGNVTKKTLTGTLDNTSSRVVANTYYDNNILNTTTDTSTKDNSGSYIKNYYDKDNNITKVETRRDQNNIDVMKYIYDNRDRKTASIKLVDETDINNAASLPNIANLRDQNYTGKIQLTTGYSYDILGNLIASIDPRAYGYLTSDTVNRNQYTTNYTYDILNRLVTTTKMINGISVFTKYYYDGVGNKKAVRNERGFYTVFTYDSLNRPLTITDPETDSSLKSYTEAQIISLADQTTNSLKKTITNGYDGVGNKIYVIDANGYRTNYVYDSLNRLQTVKAPYDPTKPDDSSTNPYNQVIEEKVYDENGNVIKDIDAKGYISGADDNSRYGTEYTYDFANHLLTVLDPEGKSKGLSFTTQYVYNQFGEKIKQTDACNNTTNYYYNSIGKLLNVKDACDVTTSYTYDNTGNMLTITNGKLKVTSYNYGTGGLLRSETDANSKVTTYKYDLSGNGAYLKDANGNETIMTYDLNNNLLSKLVSQTGDNVSFTYDNAGNRATMTDSTGVSTYTYDANNRLQNISKDGANQIGYTYDKVGNVLTATDSKGFVTSYSYDTANRMNLVFYTLGGNLKSTTYQYDINGNRKNIVYSGGITEAYQYDKNNRLITLTNTSPTGTTQNYQYTYYANGLQNTKTDSFGTTTYTYDGDGRVKQVISPGKTTLYSYDNAGNRLSMDETYTSDQYSGYIDQVSKNDIKYLIKHSDYAYSDTNALMQLVEVMKDLSGNEVLKKTTNYQYDNNGNQLSAIADYVQTNNPSSGVILNLSTYSDNTTTYDKNLDITNMVYDGFNRLTKTDSIKSGNRTITQFIYNGDGLRVKKVVKRSANSFTPQETNYLYNGQNVILETDGSSNLSVRYLMGINYIGRIDSNNNLSYFLYNGHGDVVSTIAENGTIENQYDYDIFGNLTLTLEPKYSCAIRYAGYYYDSETGLYYLKARMYDPITARFLQEDDPSYSDSIDPLSLNLYTYCSNNPILYNDPTGHMQDSGGYDPIIDFVIGEGVEYASVDLTGCKTFTNNGTADNVHVADNSTVTMTNNANIGNIGLGYNSTANVNNSTTGTIGSVTTGYLSTLNMDNSGHVDHVEVVAGSVANIKNNATGVIETVTTGYKSSLTMNNYGYVASIRTGYESSANINNYNTGQIGIVTTGYDSIANIKNYGIIGNLTIDELSRTNYKNYSTGIMWSVTDYNDENDSTDDIVKFAYEGKGNSKLYDYEKKLIAQIDSDDMKKFGYDIKKIISIYEKNKAIYEEISKETGFPPELICAIHYRESGCNFNSYLHNGDKPLGKPTKDYPSGKLFYNFKDAAVDALKEKIPVLKKRNITMSSDTTDMASICAFAEAYNGMGYKSKNTPSPYVYSGTNIYKSGKYVADHKYDPTKVDKQPGLYILVKALQNTK